MTRTPTQPFRPDWASPPGDTLAQLLAEQSMTQTELAERLGTSLKHVNRVVKGAASISGELALGLEKVFGAPAAFWMAREAQYQSDRARQEQRAGLGQYLEWARRFPLADLRKRGVLPRGGDGPELVENVLRFLGVAHPDQWRNPQAAYRKSQKFDSDPYAMSAWLRLGELDASEVDCTLFDEDRFLETLQHVRQLTSLEPKQWWPELQRRCGDAGVAVVVVDTPPGVKANGATRWLAPHKALIQLSLRYHWEDIFWFSFFHEAGHVLLHRKKDIFVEMPPKDRPSDPHEQQLEEEADRFAARTLIPPPHDRLLSSLQLEDVPLFAKSLDIAPAIVVGRMQHDGLIPYSRGNDLRRRLKLVDPN